MPTDVVIPKLGMTMKDGTIARWVVPDGARVSTGDVLFTLLTDKLEVEIEAETSGILRHGASEGERHRCSTVIGWILAEDEPDISAPPRARSAPSRSGSEADRVIATPVARRVADKLRVNLASVTGTGPGGRITKDDVERAAAGEATPPSTIPDSPAPPDATIPLSGMRQVIAERMHSSLHEMAQLTMTMEVDVTEAVALRDRLIADWATEGIRVSITDLVGRAAVIAIARHPHVNASITSEAFVIHPQVNLGIAVAVPNGLLVPVVTGAERMSLAALSSAIAQRSEDCRAGTIGLDELEGSTFTITSLGAQGVDMFTPIINPPNVAILGIGRVRDTVAFDGDRPIRRDALTLSLTIDHRALDGAPAAAFLAEIRDLLGTPLRLLV